MMYTRRFKMPQLLPKISQILALHGIKHLEALGVLGIEVRLLI